jgi:hypothetical protein
MNSAADIRTPGPGFQPISADLMRGASMGEWFLSRRDSTIVARHEVFGTGVWTFSRKVTRFLVR